MTTLRETIHVIPSADLGDENPLPAFRRAHDDLRVGVADDVPAEDRVRLGWACAHRVLPYRLQDGYDRARRPRPFQALALENEKLRATVLPELGGRLVSLVRLADGRELLERNPVFQPANLALRNAWFSGGVEWNAGLLGHHYHTCTPIFAALLRGPKGEPALRLYEWDRAKRFAFQVDLHLPPRSDFLFARVRVVNPRDEVLPMYWWTNIAVPQTDATRVLAPATTVLHACDGSALRLGRLPVDDGADQTYPARRRGALEQFFRIAPERRPWIAAVDRSGRGLVHCSTDALRGRKAFSWGVAAGGRRWQEFLSEPGRAYLEIQAGLARTQIESVAMPPRSALAWTEAFGALALDPAAAHGAWAEATGAVEAHLEHALPHDALAAIDRDLARFTRLPAERILHHGSGWANLERRRARASGERDGIPRELLFPETDGDQAPWLALLEDGALPEGDVERPAAPMTQPEWQRRLERALASGRGDHWASWWHLGNMRLENRDPRGAREAWERSLARRRTSWALRNLAVLAAREDEPPAAASGRAAPETPSRRMLALLLEAWRAGPRPTALAIELAQALNGVGEHARARRFVARLPAAARAHERLRIEAARAVLALGDLAAVERALARGFATIREGETTLTDLWFGLHERRLAGDAPVDEALRRRVRREFPPPAAIDFRVLAEVAEPAPDRRAQRARG